MSSATTPPAEGARILGRYAAIDDVPLARECADCAGAMKRGEPLRAQHVANLLERVAIELTKLPAEGGGPVPPNDSQSHPKDAKAAALADALRQCVEALCTIQGEYFQPDVDRLIAAAIAAARAALDGTQSSDASQPAPGG